MVSSVLLRAEFQNMLLALRVSPSGPFEWCEFLEFLDASKVRSRMYRGRCLQLNAVFCRIAQVLQDYLYIIPDFAILRTSAKFKKDQLNLVKFHE